MTEHALTPSRGVTIAFEAIRPGDEVERVLPGTAVAYRLRVSETFVRAVVTPDGDVVSDTEDATWHLIDRPIDEPTRFGVIVKVGDGTRRLRVTDTDTRLPGWIDPDAGFDAHPEPWARLPRPVVLVHPGYPDADSSA